MRRCIPAAALLAVAIAACSGTTAATGADASSDAGNDALFVKGVLHPQPQGAGTPCTYTADPSQAVEPSGVLDLAFSNEYTAVLLVGSHYAPPGGGSTPTGPAVEVQNASVAVTDANGSAVDSFSAPASGYIDAPTGGAPGYGPIGITLLAPTTVAKLKGMVSAGHRARVVASFTVNGQALHTKSFVYLQSDTFAFPIDVCEGCLVSFAPQDMDPSLPEPNCANWQQVAATGAMAVPCVMGQDAPVDCSACQQFPVCHGAESDGG